MTTKLLLTTTAILLAMPDEEKQFQLARVHTTSSSTDSNLPNNLSLKKSGVTPSLRIDSFKQDMTSRLLNPVNVVYDYRGDTYIHRANKNRLFSSQQTHINHNNQQRPRINPSRRHR